MTNPLKIELIPGTRFAKRIVCTLCNEQIFSVTDHPTQAEMDIEATGVGAHMEFRHGLTLTLVKCDDPKCLEH